jgi:hypothetical protein
VIGKSEWKPFSLFTPHAWAVQHVLEIFLGGEVLKGWLVTIHLGQKRVA